ncbi:uncharacterized protein VP01_2788g2 [Puccinia sorghi]|uniref:DDE Tnp4 domain-containing protein n=1 Tax=Puccinia sorghi TaxID=27349 RepID=A0A0L6V2P9_9BASI|nr:uncharacterized protein VP01_2788g2 [Puccinia sorghi]
MYKLKTLFVEEKEILALSHPEKKFKCTRDKSLTEQQDFNCHLSGKRVVIENCIGLLKDRFQSLKGLCLHLHNDNYLTWIQACVILHNFIFQGSDWDMDEAQDGENLPLDVSTWESEAVEAGTPSGKHQREHVMLCPQDFRENNA